MSLKSSLASTWSYLASRLGGSNPVPTSNLSSLKSRSQEDADWNVEIKAQTKVARKRAQKLSAKKWASPQYRSPVVEYRLVVFHKCPWFGYSGAASTKRKKKIWYEQDGDPMEFVSPDMSGYTLKVQQECLAETPELSTAVDRWLRKRKNREHGWQFKCIIEDGDKKISNRIPSRFGTFVVYVLIERVVLGPAGGLIASGREAVDGLVVARHETTVTARGVVADLPEPRSARSVADEHKMEFKKPKDAAVSRSSCHTCGVSTWEQNGGCDDIHAA